MRCEVRRYGCGVSGEILRCSAGERTYGTCSGHDGLEAVVCGSGSRWWGRVGCVRVQKSKRLREIRRYWGLGSDEGVGGGVEREGSSV